MPPASHFWNAVRTQSARALLLRSRRSVEKGSLRLAIHAFVRPNRGTKFTRHLTSECVGTALAADVMRARRVSYGVRVDCGVEPGEVAWAWAALEAQAGRVNECSGRGQGQLESEVGCPHQPVVDTMLSYLGRVEVGAVSRKKMRDVRARVGALNVWEYGANRLACG